MWSRLVKLLALESVTLDDLIAAWGYFYRANPLHSLIKQNVPNVISPRGQHLWIQLCIITHNWVHPQNKNLSMAQNVQHIS